MTGKLAEDYDFIGRRLRELERDKEIARAYPPVLVDEPVKDWPTLAEIWCSDRL
jgi:hypothetical protein